MSALLRPIAAAWRGLTRLGMRTLVLTVFAMALLYLALLAGLSRAIPQVDRGLLGPPIVRQAAAAADLMDTLDPEERRHALAALNSHILRFSLRENFPDDAPVETPARVFVPIISVYAARLGDRPFAVYRRADFGSGVSRLARLHDDIIVVMRLADGAGLVVESGEAFRRVVRFWSAAFVGGVVGLVLIGLMAWASLSYARPLGRLARAARSFVEGARTSGSLNPLPETGPRPVRELAAALNLAGEELMQAMVERTTTLAAIAHDLRTYLTRLRMRAEFIADEDRRAKAVRDVEDMAQLVEDTLLLGRGAAGPRRTEALDLGPWLRDFVARRAELGDPVRLREGGTGASEASARVEVAPAELVRALDNLVGNALRYAGAASVALAEAGAGRVAVEVLDDGPGVPESFLASMSAPFTRLEGSRSRDTGGAGLGLAIVKALVEQAGGTLSLANRPEGGFAARIVLPLA